MANRAIISFFLSFTFSLFCFAKEPVLDPSSILKPQEKGALNARVENVRRAGVDVLIYLASAEEKYDLAKVKDLVSPFFPKRTKPRPAGAILYYSGANAYKFFADEKLEQRLTTVWIRNFEIRLNAGKPRSPYITLEMSLQELRLQLGKTIPAEMFRPSSAKPQELQPKGLSLWIYVSSIAGLIMLLALLFFWRKRRGKNLKR